MPPLVQPTQSTECEMYPIISRTKLDPSVSQDFAITMKLNRFLTKFKLVIKSAILRMKLRVCTVWTDIILGISEIFYLTQTIVVSENTFRNLKLFLVFLGRQNYSFQIFRFPGRCPNV